MLRNLHLAVTCRNHHSVLTAIHPSPPFDEKKESPSGHAADVQTRLEMGKWDRRGFVANHNPKTEDLTKATNGLVAGIPTPLKNMSQMGLLFPIYGKKNQV